MNEGLAPRFHALFAGLERAHGAYQNIDFDHARSDGKYKGEAVTKREPVTDALWQQHLDGNYGVGIIPIRDDSTVVFGAVDVDVYADLDPARVAATAAKQGFPLVTCRSKSGGVHLYLFCTQPVPAAKMQAKLREMASKLGHGQSEIFPKQAKMGADLGSWINMPYFHAVETNRYAVMATGDAMTADEFLTAAEAAKVGPDFFDEAKAQGEKKDKKASPLPDGPPCLQHLMELGFPPGTWNVGVFNLGIYCRKARPSDWKEHLVSLNAKNFPNEPASDLNGVISSLAKKDYVYQCAKQPLMGYCNQTECRRRKYGVGSGASSFPVLKELRKLETAPPVWFLDVDSNGTGATLELSTEELLDPGAFQKKCTEYLNIVPMLPTKIVWQQAVQALMAEGILKKVDPPPEDSSTEGQFWELLEQFCTGRAQAHTKEEILGGKPFTENGRTYFRTSDLLKYLTRMQFKDYRVQQVTKVLKMRKTKKDGKDVEYCKHEPTHIGKKFLNLWSIEAFEKSAEEWEVPQDSSKAF